jgi:hypothetical protein
MTLSLSNKHINILRNSGHLGVDEVYAVRYFFEQGRPIKDPPSSIYIGSLVWKEHLHLILLLKVKQ